LWGVLETIVRNHGLDPTDIEVWFGDEARIDQKNKIIRRWARRGSRPSPPSDQRTASTYIFGAICPKAGKAVGLIPPWCNTEMINLHLAAISTDVTPGHHAALLLDPAGWHLSTQLTAPDNTTIVPLQPNSPELNAQESVWQLMRESWFSNCVFWDIDDLADHCSYTWNRLDDRL
jgi:putative transposase